MISLNIIKKHSMDGLVLALLIWICTSSIGTQTKTAEMSVDINWLKSNQLLTNVAVTKLNDQLMAMDYKLTGLKTALEIHMGKRVSVLKMRDTTFISLSNIQDRLK